jgi:hypothetical protein
MKYTRLPLLLLLVLISLPAAAQVRRCTGPEGTTIFTDRQCQDLGAVERVPHAAASAETHLYRNVCSRNLQDLVYALTAAVDSRDVNQFAGVYDWAGMSTRTGYAIMDRLQAIVQRPLVDVTPIYRASDIPADGDYYPQTTVRHVPVGLRLEQTLANGSTPSQTVLGLRSYLGCWWVNL